MNQQNKSIEHRKWSIYYEGKFFIIGIFVGAILFMGWNYLLNYPNWHKSDSDIIRTELKTVIQDKLLSYVNGQWFSSIGDVELRIDVTDKQSFLIIQSLTDAKDIKEYKIVNIKDITGIMGIINLELCDKTYTCSNEELIPIQVNKIFGVDNTITLTYDRRLTYCIDFGQSCTRAFKKQIRA